MDPIVRKDDLPTQGQKPPQTNGKNWTSFFLDTVMYYLDLVRYTALMLFSAAVIHRYDPRSASSGAAGPQDLEMFILKRTLPLGESLGQPSFWVFLIACLSFALFFGVFGLLKHKNDTYLTFFIVGGLFIAQVADGLYTGLYTNGGAYTFFLKSFVPVSLVGAVLLSAACHGLVRRKQQASYKRVAAQEELDVKGEKAGHI